ncbi:MAG: helix-turn-helix domain-containing protein [Pyrinomonadaceae bacterium]|nr:helix-turn-helix domain-containing protein [Pyrinomonadaceae bacterium]
MVQIDFLNFRSILVFICILQGLVFAGLLIARGVRQRSKADLWLALLIGLLCSSLITPFIGFANVYDNNQWLTYFPFSIAYSYGVCVWFYTVNLTDSRHRLKGRDLLLFVPTMVYLMYRLFLFSHTVEWKSWFDGNYGDVFGAAIFVTEAMWNLVLLVFSIRHYRKYRVWLDENFSDTEKIKFDWLRNFLYLFTAVVVLGALFDFANSFVVKLSYIQYFYFEIVLALATYYLAVAGYLRSRTIELTFDDRAEPADEPRRSLLSDGEMDRLKTRLLTVMSEERPYLDPSLTLTDLTRSVGVNTTVLSHLINKGFNKNFNDFINEHRIHAVKSKLRVADDETVLAIAFDCGFNSKATFNRAFKKFTGMTPREYQEKLTSS